MPELLHFCLLRDGDKMVDTLTKTQNEKSNLKPKAATQTTGHLKTVGQ